MCFILYYVALILFQRLKYFRILVEHGQAEAFHRTVKKLTRSYFMRILHLLKLFRHRIIIIFVEIIQYYNVIYVNFYREHDIIYLKLIFFPSLESNIDAYNIIYVILD